MAISMVVKVACLAVMCMVLSLPKTHASLSCGQVQTKVASCIKYLRGSGNVVPQPCCDGIRTVNNQANNTPDRQAVCKCLKRTTENFPGLNQEKLAGLPQKCGVNLPYQLSPSIDCDKVH